MKWKKGTYLFETEKVKLVVQRITNAPYLVLFLRHVELLKVESKIDFWGLVTTWLVSLFRSNVIIFMRVSDYNFSRYIFFSEVNLYVRQGILKGKYHCTVDLLFDWFGLVCFANKNKNCKLSYSWFQTSQTGGQLYSDTSPFSIPCVRYSKDFLRSKLLNSNIFSWQFL